MSGQVARRVLLTGGGRGIGAAMGELLRARGAEVTAPPRSELDLGNRDSVEAWLARHRTLQVDILINNAGINALRSLEELEAPVWDEMLQTNLTAAVRLIQVFAPGMAQRGWGRILNLSTIFSLVTKERRSAYSMTKAALNALTRSAAVEFGPGGVLVNALAPGYVDTALTRQNNTPEALAAICATIPLGRMARVEELAQVAAFLVSEENTYLTGQVVVADGGFVCR